MRFAEMIPELETLLKDDHTKNAVVHLIELLEDDLCYLAWNQPGNDKAYADNKVANSCMYAFKNMLEFWQVNGYVKQSDVDELVKDLKIDDKW